MTRTGRTSGVTYLQLALGAAALLGLVVILASTSHGGNGNGNGSATILSCFDPAFVAQSTVDRVHADPVFPGNRKLCKATCKGYRKLCEDMTRENEKCAKDAVKDAWKIETQRCFEEETGKERKECRQGVTADRNAALRAITSGSEQGKILCKRFFNVTCPGTYCPKEE